MLNKLQLLLLMLLLQRGSDGGCEGAKCRIVTKFFKFFIFTVKFMAPLATAIVKGESYGGSGGGIHAKWS